MIQRKKKSNFSSPQAYREFKNSGGKLEDDHIVNKTDIPAIKPTDSKKKIALQEQRKLWQSKYSYWLARKNKFYEKLAEKRLDPGSNDRYKLLAAKVKEYWQLLHDSKPVYQSIKNQ